MKKINMIFAVMAAAFLVSCEQKVYDEPVANPDDGLVPVAISAGAGSFGYDISTRSGLSSMMKDGFGFMGFNTGQALFDADLPEGLVFDNFKMTSSDGENWDYSGKIAYWNRSTTEKYTFLAYHPYSESQSGVILQVPAGSKIGDCKDYMAAAPVLNKASRGEVKFAFRHIFSKINTVIRLTDEYTGQEYTLKNVTFADVMEYPSYSLARGDFDRENAASHDISSEEENIKGATLSTLDQRITVDPIYISPYAYASSGKNIVVSFDFEYTFTDPSGGKEVQYFTKEFALSEDFEANHEYNLDVVFTPDEKGAVDMNVTVDDYSEKTDIDMVIEQSPEFNLSKHGTANSYIVPNRGNYHFDAVYKGNSTVEEIGDIASVEVLWETFGTEEAVVQGNLISDLRYDCGIISFTASEKEGNALIAAKDADGVILWSWHMWLTDRPSDHVYNDGGKAVMDRNLGALSAFQEDGVKTYGLLYQWGRKDPFLNVGATLGVETAANTGNWPEMVTDMQTSGWADANPMTYICRNVHVPRWIDVEDPYRWKTPDGEKSVYDPCPPGYRVPSELHFTSETVSQFPVTSYFTITNDGALSGDRKGYLWLDELADGGFACLMNFTDRDTVKAENHASSNAYSVRCVKE